MPMPVVDDLAAPAGDKTCRPTLRTISAVVNPASGSVRDGASDELSRIAAKHGHQLRLFTIVGQNVEAVVRDAVSGNPDLLVVLAGDGTAGLAAELCGPHGPLVAPLPGGTMNMLPRALYGAAPWQLALDAILESGVERIVGGGRVCGKTFHVAAILGMPALWGHAREALRAGKLVEAIRRMDLAFRRAFAGNLKYGGDGAPGRSSEALALICPLVSKAVEHEITLEMAALEFHDAREMARLALRGALGAWRDDPAVSVELVDRGWATTRGSIPAILDGETHKLPRRAEFEFVPRAFRALAAPNKSVNSL
jgi:diacylglycerol kinase family enzyme